MERDSRKCESDNDSLGDDKNATSDSENETSDENYTTNEFNVNTIQSSSNIFRPNSSCSSESSLTESDDEEDNLSPELFGLLDNPGVVRFDCVDYPLEVTKNSDEEYGMKQKTDQNWLKASCCNLTLYINDIKGTLKHSNKRKL